MTRGIFWAWSCALAYWYFPYSLCEMFMMLLCFTLFLSRRCDNDFSCVIPEYTLRIKFMGTYFEIALGRMPQNTFEDKSALVQVMAWCRQATSHYLEPVFTQIYVSILHHNKLTSLWFPVFWLSRSSRLFYLPSAGRMNDLGWYTNT